MSTLTVDPYVAPASYDELFRNYYGWLRRVVIARGIPLVSADDVTMSILTTFMEKDALKSFDPDREYTSNGKPVRSNFRKFITHFFVVYLQHYRDVENRNNKRNLELPEFGDEVERLCKDDISFSTVWSEAIQNLLLSELSERSQETFTAVLLLLEADEPIMGVTIAEILSQSRKNGYRRLEAMAQEAHEILTKHGVL